MTDDEWRARLLQILGDHVDRMERSRQERVELEQRRRAGKTLRHAERLADRIRSSTGHRITNHQQKRDLADRIRSSARRTP